MAEKGSSKLQHPNAALLQSATKGFDFLFSNDLVGARAHFEKGDDPFHLMGLGVCAFLEAALGMEVSALFSLWLLIMGRRWLMFKVECVNG